MTRINVVPASELCDQHLLAEHRELTRIPNNVASGKYKVFYSDRSEVYTLGPGHVKFFTNKLDWLLNRYASLSEECRLRGFKVIDKWPSDLNVSPWSQENYKPTLRDMALNRARIKDRWPKQARYYGAFVQHYQRFKGTGHGN
jgi:hypothetical protein